jgi:putative peptidoglycan lipid II flippase
VTTVDVDRAEASLARSAAAITAGNAVSRATGFVRVVAVAAALGTTFLGNTYQTSNLVSNVLFELLAAGLLASVLVPRFVSSLAAGQRRDAQEVAGALLSLCLVALGVIALAGAAAGHLVMRALTVAVSDPAVREREIRLGAFFLWFFLPQILLYAWGAIATALLHADRKFAASAFAPAANNVVVIATMAVFWAMRHGGGHSAGAVGLDLPVRQQAVLAIGTTIGVLAMTAMPVIACWRAGLALRPRWAPNHPGVRGLGRDGLWAGGYLALKQLLVAATLVLANRVEGGVVAYQVAFTFFLLPHALLAHPVFTALYPRLAADADAGRMDDFRRQVTSGAATVAVLMVPASVALALLGGPVLRAVRVGALDASGAHFVGKVVAAYAIGLVGYSVLQLLTRAAYAVHDTASPTVVSAVVTVLGVGAMIAFSSLASGENRVVVLGLVHSAVMIVGAGALLGVVARRMGGLGRPALLWRR